MKLIEQIKLHESFESMTYEGEDGYWVILKDGYTINGTSSVHENTLTKVLKSLKQQVQKISK